MRVSVNVDETNGKNVCIRINGHEAVLSPKEFDSLKMEIMWASRVISESDWVDYKTSMYREIQHETLHH